MLKAIMSSNHSLGRLATSSLSWHLGWLARRKVKPLSCSLYITNICNFRCIFCKISRNPKKEILDISLFTDIINTLQHFGTYYLSFSGGEPFMVKNIIRYIAYASERIPYTHVVTNGYLLDRPLIKELSGTMLKEISISLDGDKRVHDSVRGVEGAFDKVWEAIYNLKEIAPNIKIIVNSIILPENLSSLLELNAKLREIGVEHKFQAVINKHPMFGGQKGEAERFSFDAESLHQLESFCEQMMRSSNVMNSRFYLKHVPLLYRNKIGGALGRKCLLGYHHVEVLPDGSIFPCLTGMDWRNGFKKKSSYKKLIQSQMYKDKVKQLERCRACEKNMFICYWEPRSAFPIWNFCRFTLLRPWL